MPTAPPLRIGYVALTGAAPLLAAEEFGFFARQGIRVSLSEEGAWAAVRDKLAFGALDGAHLLRPMPIALACGLGGVSAALSAGAGIGRNGNTITLSTALAAEAGLGGRSAPPLAPGAFAGAVRARAAAGSPPVRLAAVFPFHSTITCCGIGFRSAGSTPTATCSSPWCRRPAPRRRSRTARWTASAPASPGAATPRRSASGASRSPPATSGPTTRRRCWRSARACRTRRPSSPPRAGWTIRRTARTPWP